MLTSVVQGLKVYTMSDGEFNLPLWNERFENMKEDIADTKKSISDLKKLMIATIIGITGWSLVQLYANISTAHASVIPTMPTVAVSKK